MLSKCIALKALLIVFITTSLNEHSIAQNSLSYNELSSNFYLVRKDSLKASFKCPDQFTKKETQKKFKEIWDSRTAYLFESIGNNQYVAQPTIYNYTYNILQEIINGNKKWFPQSTFLLIDRSSAVNAYAMGNNIIAVNMGLFAFVKTREELALVLAHELAHNALKHAENSMAERAELLTSEKYKTELEEISKSTYGKYSKLIKILEGYSYGSAKHNRYHESEADSLAQVFLANSKMAYDPKIFLRLDSADYTYKTDLQKNIVAYFEKNGITIDEAWTKKTTKGLSTRKYNFKELTLTDSLKTHPDCIDRYKFIATKAPNSATTNTLLPTQIVNDANENIIWFNIINNNLTAALYRIFLEQDKGNNSIWYEEMTSLVLTKLYNADKKFERFNAVNVEKKELISSKYFELQTLFEQIPREKLVGICEAELNKPYWQNVKADAKALKTILKNNIYSESLNPKDATSIKDNFEKSYPSSLLRELVEKLF